MDEDEDTDVINREYVSKDTMLERLRAEKADLIEDIRQREIENILDAPVVQREIPGLVHKDRWSPRQLDETPVSAVPFTDEQMEIVATVIAELRIQLRSEADIVLAQLRERMAHCEGAIAGLIGKERGR
jgi:hypothetical protein